MLKYILLLIAFSFVAACSYTPIFPHEAEVLNVPPPHPMPDLHVKLVNTTKYDEDSNRRGLSYYTYENRAVSNVLINGLANTIERAGGHVDHDAGRVMTIEVEWLNVSGPAGNAFDYTSSGRTRMRLQLGKGERFRIKSNFSELFPAKERKDYLEDAMTGTLKTAIKDILDDERVRKYLSY